MALPDMTGGLLDGFFSHQALVILLFYVILILTFFGGWLRTAKYPPGGTATGTTVSILIPCRNEAGNIPSIIKHIDNQDYPTDQLEVIWIDDHSYDGTGELLEELALTRDNCRVIHLPPGITGKKAALKAGAEASAGEFILLTDADCRLPEGWAGAMVRYAESTGSALVLGPVVLDPAVSPAERLQKLEYLSLSMTAAGSAGAGLPVMAQGPNIGIRSSLYRQLAGMLDDRFASGDDVFLLQAAKRVPDTRIAFARSRDAMVGTPPARGLKGFLRQRIRWASKARGYRDPLMAGTSLLVLAMNMEIIAALAGALAGWCSPVLPAILFAGKVAADMPLMIAGLIFYRSMRLVTWILPAQAAYPFYAVLAATMGVTGRFTWKSRDYSP